MPDITRRSLDTKHHEAVPSGPETTSGQVPPAPGSQLEKALALIPGNPGEEGEDFSETLYERLSLVVDKGQEQEPSAKEEKHRRFRSCGDNQV